MMSPKPGSCDTFVVLPPYTAGKSIVFGKNSDRPSSEVQEVVYYPAQEHAGNATVKCTYIEVEQAKHTFAVILSKPNWMWGAEMGANEKGLCIGNEAVFTNMASEKDIEKRLLGMDLLRLALERAATAHEALHVITKLLEKHGQGGPCSDTMTDFTYHNSFLICDSKEAWVLETAGYFWVAEHLTEGYRNISNCLSIKTKIDLMSEGLKENVQQLGLWDGTGSFDFAKTFSTSYEPGCDRFINGGKLLERLTKQGIFTACEMFEVLRDEESGICRRDGHFITTAAQVSVISPGDSKRPSVHWFTGTPDPKLSIFKPFIFTDNCSNFTKLLTSPNNGEPSVDRKHRIYVLRELALKQKTKALDTLLEMEQKCYRELEEFLNNVENNTANLQELDGFFNDCVETEAKFYTGGKNNL